MQTGLIIKTHILSAFLLSINLYAEIITTPPASTPPQIPSFDYKNMTTAEILKLPPEQLSTIGETAFSQIFGSTPVSQTVNSAASQISNQATAALNNIQNQTTQLTQNIASGLNNLGNMNLSNLNASNLSSLSSLGSQSVPSIPSASLGNSSKDKIAQLNSLQANISQKIAAQNIAKARLLILYREDLLLHKKIAFTQSKIVQMEKLK